MSLKFPAKFQSQGWRERETHAMKGKGKQGKGRERYVIFSTLAGERRALANEGKQSNMY